MMKLRFLISSMLVLIVLLSGCVSRQQHQENTTVITGRGVESETETSVDDFTGVEEVYDFKCLDRFDKVSSGIVYEDKLFFSGCDKIFVLDGEHWSSHEPRRLINGTGYTQGTLSMKVWGVYNNRLYAASPYTLFTLNDKMNWERVLRLPAGTNAVASMRVYDEKFYVGTEDNYGTHHVYDGRVWRNLTHPCNASERRYVRTSSLVSLEIFENRLYGFFTGCNNSFYVLSGASWTPVPAKLRLRPYDEVGDLKVYKGKLYMTIKDEMYEYNRTTVERVDDPLMDSIKGRHWLGLVVHNNRLYAYSKFRDTNKKVTAVSHDGSAWNTPEWNGSIDRPYSLVSYRNKLYAISQDGRLYRLE